MSKKRLLHEVLAADQDRQHSANIAIDETIVTLTKKSAHFLGQNRKVSYFDESREGENTDETKAMDDTVMKRIKYAASRVTPYYDVLLTKEATNQVAAADVVVDGVTLLENVPGNFLLSMEKRLDKLMEMYKVIPTLAPGVEWTEDESLGKGVYRSPALPQMKTEKILEPLIMYEATKEHPAQVKEVSRDKPVARIETTHYSGMITPARKSVLLGRLEKLRAAVKKARMQSNNAEIIDRKAGKAFFDYLHAE